MTNASMNLFAHLQTAQTNSGQSEIKDRAASKLSDDLKSDFKTHMKQLLKDGGDSTNSSTSKIDDSEQADMLAELLDNLLEELDALISDEQFLEKMESMDFLNDSMLQQLQNLESLYSDLLDDFPDSVEELELEELAAFTQLQELTQALSETKNMLEEISEQELEDLDELFETLNGRYESNDDALFNPSTLQRVVEQSDLSSESDAELLAKNLAGNESGDFEFNKVIETDSVLDEILVDNWSNASSDDIKSQLENMAKIRDLMQLLTQQNKESEKLFSQLSQDEERLLKEILAIDISSEQNLEKQITDRKHLESQISALLGQAKNDKASPELNSKLQELLASMTEKAPESRNEQFLMGKFQSILSSDSLENALLDNSILENTLLQNNDNVAMNFNQNPQFFNQQLNFSEQAINQSFEEVLSQRNQELVSNIREVIMQQVNLEQDSDTYTMKMQLNAKQIGQLKMQFSYQDGELRGHIFTQDVQARDLIQTNLVDLRHQLGEQGLEFSELDVSVDQDDSDQAEQYDLFQFGSGNYSQITDEQDGEEQELVPESEGLNGYESSDYYQMSPGSMDLRV